MTRTSPVTDRRILRTRGLLHEALTALVHEKGYDAVSVRDILERANVGRSTFYMHFDGKDDLLASAIRETLLPARATDRHSAAARRDDPLEFSLRVFEHIHRQRSLGKNPMDRKGRALLHGHLQAAVTEWLVDDMRRASRGRRGPASSLPRELVAQYVAATFALVLNWWLEHGGRPDPKEADAMFRGLVAPTFERELGLHAK